MNAQKYIKHKTSHGFYWRLFVVDFNDKLDFSGLSSSVNPQYFCSNSLMEPQLMPEL
ncbi:MAG: hypothetical protein ACI9LX_000786 [Paraglaciecola sp.]|jgi:hypothetical protein